MTHKRNPNFCAFTMTCIPLYLNVALRTPYIGTSSYLNASTYIISRWKYGHIMTFLCVRSARERVTRIEKNKSLIIYHEGRKGGYIYCTPDHVITSTLLHHK